MNYFFLKTDTFKYPLYLGDIRAVDQSIDTNADPFTLKLPQNYVIVSLDTTQPEFDRNRQYLAIDVPYKEGTVWKSKYVVKEREPGPAIEIANGKIGELLLKWQYTKDEDNDSYFTRVEKQTYRNLLRGIPDQVGFPFVIEWPLEPSTIPFYNKDTHKPKRAKVTIDGVLVNKWEIVALTEDEKRMIRVEKFSEISMRQARLILLQEGLLAQVETAINNIQDATQKAAAKIEWEYSQTVKINSPLVKTIAAVIGLTQEQVESLFEAGSKL